MSNPDIQALYSASSEKALLGCLLADRELMDDALGQLTKEDFFVPAHQTVFGAMKDIYLESRTVIDHETVFQKLTDWKEADNAGGRGFLAELMVSYSTSQAFSSYLAIVKDKAKRRNLNRTLDHLKRQVFEQESTFELLEMAEREMFAATRPIWEKKQESYNAKECCEDFRRFLDEVTNGISLGRVATGIKCIDTINQGLPKPAMSVFAGPPGGGKSALMGTLIENWCKLGLSVGIFSLDMTKRAVIQRRVGSLAEMDTRIFNDRLSPEELKAAMKALEGIAEWNFRINDNPRLSSPDIGKQARKWKSEGIDLFILDHFQRIASSGRYHNKLEEKEQAARDIACLAKELDAVFVVLSQIKAPSQKDGTASTIDLAETKVLGEEARAVFILKEKIIQGVKPNVRAVPFKIIADKYSEGETHEGEAIFNMRVQRIS